MVSFRNPLSDIINDCRQYVPASENTGSKDMVQELKLSFQGLWGGGEREGGGGGEKEESSGEKGERILTEHVVPNLDLDFSASTHHFLVDLKTLLVYYR